MPPGRAKKFERHPTAAKRGARIRDYIQLYRSYRRWKEVNELKNWKTTLAGIAVMIGTPLATAGEGWVQLVGGILVAIGGGAGFISAADAPKK